MSSFFDRIGWHPGIGDPTIMGWVTVVAYFVAAYLAFDVFKRRNKIFRQRRESQARLWAGIALLLLALGINKQLDLQSFFTAYARFVFLEMGVYGSRRLYQVTFIAFILISVFVTMAILLRVYARVLKHHMWGIVGVGFLLGFVFIRASSFHHMDLFIGFKIAGVAMNWVMELGGIGLIAYNAWYLRQIALRNKSKKTK